MVASDRDVLHLFSLHDKDGIAKRSGIAELDNACQGATNHQRGNRLVADDAAAVMP